VLDTYHSLMAGVAKQYPLLRMAVLHHQNTRGQPLTFKDKPYLVEMYTDLPQCSDAVIRKAVQTGVSELCIQLALERSGWAGRIVAYVLPTYSIRDRFVQKRVDPLLQHVAAYRHRCPGGEQSPTAGRTRKAAGNLKMKQFGKGTMLFLGSNTPGDFVEFSADMLIIDEFDRCDPTNLAKARDRLRASPYPQEVRLGNPSLPRVGISKLYDDSDARRWFFRCGGCGHRQPLDWFGNVVQRDDDGSWILRDASRAKHLAAVRANHPGAGNDVRPVCRKCAQPFERNSDGALWVPMHPDRKVRGYTMSRLDVLSDSLWALFAEWLKAQGDNDRMSAFYTSVLGIPFEFSGARVTHTMLGESAQGAELDYLGSDDYRDRVVTCGVDVGSVLNVTVTVVEPPRGNNEDPTRRAVWVGAVRTFDEVADVLRRYHVDLCCIDAGPETRMAQGLRDQFIHEGGAVVWLARFHPTPRVGVQRYGMRLDYQAQVVTVDRTAVFDATFDDLRNGARVFPSDVFTVLAWSDQMRAPVRVLDENRGRIVWTKGVDHYRLSDVYDRVAFDLLEMGGSYSTM
jgi:hypothetical protein